MTTLIPAISAIGDATKARVVMYSNGQLVQAPLDKTVQSVLAPLKAALNDSSSIAGNASKFWNPLYFGNAGTAIVHRLNRLLVGEAALNSSDVGPVTTKDWMETLLGNTTAVSQFASVSATGQLASMSAARSSDYRTIFGAATGGAQGVTGIGYNDDTTPATTPIAAGVVGIGIHKTGVNGITLNQFDINSTATTVSTTPFNGVVSGSTWSAGLTAGSFGGVATQNATGAMYIGAGATTKFNKGIISMNGALDTTVGSGGGGVTYEAYRGQSFRWLNSSNTVDAELWGAATGLTTNSTMLISQNAVHQATGSGTLLHLEAADTVNAQLQFDTFLGNNVVSFRTADGTSASPSPVGSGRTLASISGTGYANGAYQGARSAMVFKTTEAWTATNQGANVAILATPEGTAANVTVATFSGAGLTANQGFSRGAPVTQTASFTLASNQNWIICNGTATITVTLPAASLFNGREMMIQTIAAFTVVSASSNVTPLGSATAGTAILAATAGKWATLVSDGTNWRIMQAN